MIVHSSALLAILMDEAAGEAMLQTLLDAPAPRMAATDFLTVATMVEERGGRLAALKFDAFFRETRIAIVPVDAAQMDVARTAWRHFGGKRHSARLELGDCLAYALAKTSGENLLHAEPAFARTDIPAARP
jgi:ribonuclease VapC